MSNLLITVKLKQTEDVRRAFVGTDEFAGPALHFQVNEGDSLDDFDPGEASFDVRRRTVCVNPFEDVLDGPPYSAPWQ